jgi:AcrR family transcriptional regulator
MSKKKGNFINPDIVNAASIVFQRWGVNKTTMEDIACEAGKGKSTLYYYYKNKDEIFRDLAISKLNRVVIKAKISADQKNSSREKLKYYCLAMLNELKNLLDEYPIVKEELNNNKEFMKEISRLICKKHGAILLDFLQKGMDAGEFTHIQPSELNEVTNVTITIVFGLALYLSGKDEDNFMTGIINKWITEWM